MNPSEKRVALVTGANRGIGLEIAKQLAAKDLRVIIGARNDEKGAAARQHLAGYGYDVHNIRLDVTDAASIAAAIGHIADTFERLDILVNNAGIMIDQDTGVLDLPLALLQNTIETNAFGPLLLSQGCVPIMRSHRYGRIVNLSSTLGSFHDMSGSESSVAARSPAYRLSKALLNGITVLLAGGLGNDNILVNAVCPGWVRTDLGGPRAPTSPEQAADTPVWLATLPDNGPTGGFFRERQRIDW